MALDNLVSRKVQRVLLVVSLPGSTVRTWWWWRDDGDIVLCCSQHTSTCGSYFQFLSWICTLVLSELCTMLLLLPGTSPPSLCQTICFILQYQFTYLILREIIPDPFDFHPGWRGFLSVFSSHSSCCNFLLCVCIFPSSSYETQCWLLCI